MPSDRGPRLRPRKGERRRDDRDMAFLVPRVKLKKRRSPRSLRLKASPRLAGPQGFWKYGEGSVKQLLSLLVWLLLAGSANAGENPWADYRFAPDALMEIDLASDAAWTLSVDDGPARPIKVTAGGWNSDQQEPQIPTAGVKDHVTYERAIATPAEARGRAVKLLFGGCNYGAEVLLDGRKIAEHHAPMTPFEADLTGIAEPGRTHVLRVKAYHRWHYGKPPVVTAGFDFNRGVSKQYEGHTKYPYGLTGTCGWLCSRSCTFPTCSFVPRSVAKPWSTTSGCRTAARGLAPWC